MVCQHTRRGVTYIASELAKDLLNGETTHMHMGKVLPHTIRPNTRKQTKETNQCLSPLCLPPALTLTSHSESHDLK